MQPIDGVALSVRFSLIVATLERVADVEALLVSLCAQSFTDFEVIIVDQNEDDRLAAMMGAFAGRLKLTRLRSETKRLSHARNLGIAAASGEILAFPDDDCVYPPNVLQLVQAAFAADSDLAVLSGPAFSPSGQPGSGRWQTASGVIDIRTVWTSVIAFNLFARAAMLNQIGGFDEQLGVGARFGSAEETDLVIRIMQAGGKCFYDFNLRVIHPDKTLSAVAASRAFAYGTGMGHVLRKHRVGAPTVIKYMVRPLGGVAVSLLKLNLLSANYYWQTLRGRAHGFIATKKE